MHVRYVQSSVCIAYALDTGEGDKPAKKEDIHAPPKNIGELKLQEKVRYFVVL